MNETPSCDKNEGMSDSYTSRHLPPTFQLHLHLTSTSLTSHPTSVLLERIVEFEEAEKDRIAGRVHDPHLQRHTGAFPRSLTSQRAKNAFEANLKQAMVELETEDHDVDPMMTSRHVGPAARKRQAEEEASVREVGARGEDDSVSAATVAAVGGTAAAAGGAGGRRAKRQRGAGANRNSVPGK